MWMKVGLKNFYLFAKMFSFSFFFYFSFTFVSDMMPLFFWLSTVSGKYIHFYVFLSLT